ncbi:MAG TPA: hypothetical protein VG502_20155 [Flexivirga sp.]|uniref:hypothetical protein n=1 Tax=Flexivirga sp. TaxID=1962927 RepID=UPI002C9B136E|nr:hypothetical protein [Flexivirga sp.]HWC24616.1 hypothetical protein [Flexivirga sp.]
MSTSRVAGVPGWARKAALVVPLVVLPSSLWRIAAFTLHLPIIKERTADDSGNLPWWMPLELYVVLLSVVSELLAFTAIGLVSTWGEVFPRWVPFLRGRRVPTLAAVIPGALGAAVLTTLWTYSIGMLALGRTMTGADLQPGGALDVHTWQGVLAVTMYAPLVLWGPLLAAVTIAYYRRRR